jgi:hypothetical protein
MLISLTMIGGVFAVLYNFGRLNSTRISSESNGVCEQIARSSMDNLRSYGIERTKSNVSLVANTISRPNANQVKGVSISDNDAWAGSNSQLPLIVATGGAQPPISNSFLSSVGAMSALAVLYRGNSQYCSTDYGLPYNNANLLIQGGAANPAPLTGVTDRFQSVNTTLKIQSYNLDTSAVGCDNFFPVAAAENNTPTAQGSFTYPPYVTSNYGFWVTVTTRFTEPSGKSGICATSSLFQYPRRTTETSSAISGSINATAGMGYCQTAMTGSSTDIYLPPQSVGKDWVLLCQDQSVGGFVLPNDCPGRVQREPMSIANTAWVRCEQVSMCGVNNAGFAWIGTSQLRLTHGSLKWGCRPQLGVRLVDPAQNLITQSTLTSASVNAWLGGPACYTTACGQRYCGSPPYCDPCAYGGCAPSGGGGGGHSSDGGDGTDGHDGSGGGGDGCDN